MSHTAQHCFLLDGKTTLPIDHNYQLFIPLNIINNIKSINNNKYCQVDEEDLCSRSITKLSDNKHVSRKIVTAKRNNIETCMCIRSINHFLVVHLCRFNHSYHIIDKLCYRFYSSKQQRVT